MSTHLHRSDNTTDKRALARRIGHQLAGKPEVCASFLAGSIMEGFGNATSDMDIYLIGPGLKPERRQLAVDATRVDVHRLPSDEIEAVVGRVLSGRPLSDGTVPPIADQDLALVGRLWTAEVLTGEAEITASRDRLRAGWDRVRRQVMFKWLTAAHADLEDYTGLRANGDVDAAMALGRSALIAAGKAVAAAGGELYAGSKWVWRQLERSAPPRFPRNTLSELFRSDLSDPSSRRSFADLEVFTQTCLAVVSTLGWQNVPLRHWPDWESGKGPLSRAPGFYARAFDDAIVVTRPAARRVRLRHEVGVVWGLCNGISDETVLAQLRTLRESSAVYETCTDERCREIIASLVDAELVLRSG